MIDDTLLILLYFLPKILIKLCIIIGNFYYFKFLLIIYLKNFNFYFNEVLFIESFV